MAITPLPTPPNRVTDTDPTVFAEKSATFLGALPSFATEANSLAADVNADKVDAETAAATATTKASEALASANAAAQSAIDATNNGSAQVLLATGQANAAQASANAAAASAVEAGALVEKYLGALATDPTTDKTGGALTAGDWYVNSTSGLIRAYTGAEWVNGLSAIAGVSSVNGQQGDVIVNGGAMQEFTTSGTWTKPSGISFVMVECWGAGGGGGSGRVGAAGTTRTGGGGGGGGAYNYRLLKASEVGATETITIGAGGIGGASIATNDTNGSVGTNGGNTFFGGLVAAYGGGYGFNGNNGVATVGGGGGGTLSAANGSNGGAPKSGTTTDAFGGASASGNTNSFFSGFGGASGSGCGTSSVGGPGGISVYGGCGGTGGGGINTSNSSFNYASVATCRMGSGGSSGTSLSLTAASSLRIAYGNGILLSQAVAGFLVKSVDDGVTWEFVTNSSGLNLSPLFFDGVKWFAKPSGNDLYTSTNLVDWTLVASIPGAFQDVAFANGLYVAVGNSGLIHTSNDGVTWTQRTSGVTASLNSVIHDGTRWIVSGSAYNSMSVILTSTDGIAWTLNQSSINMSISSSVSNGTRLVVNSNTSPYLHYSDDFGLTFTAATVSGLTGIIQSNKGIVFADGLFVHAANNSLIYTSTDGITWTVQTDGTTDAYGQVIHTGTSYFVTSNTSNANVGIRSTDGVTWTTQTATPLYANGGNGGDGSIACGGGGGAAALNGYSSGAGGNGGNGLCRVFWW